MIKLEKDGLQGYALCADATQQSTVDAVTERVPQFAAIVTDPPYGNILNEDWDRVGFDTDTFVTWMIGWTKLWGSNLAANSAVYVWGGIGIPGFRPFYRYIDRIERESEYKLATHITWAKKRGYGVQNNYLFAREECAYLIKGDPKKPRVFNVPYLAEKRGYAGYNTDYPAKSEYYRRTTVWNDVTEILRGKVHVAQKAQRVIEIPIEVSSHEGEWIVDPFAGSFTTAYAAAATKRNFVVVEADAATFSASVERMISSGWTASEE